MLSKLLESTTEERREGFRKLHNEERHDMQHPSNNITVDQMKEGKAVGVCGPYGEI